MTDAKAKMLAGNYGTEAARRAFKAHETHLMVSREAYEEKLAEAFRAGLDVGHAEGVASVGRRVQEPDDATGVTV